MDWEALRKGNAIALTILPDTLDSGGAPVKIALVTLLSAFALTLCSACGGELSDDDVLKKLAPSLVTIQFRGRDIGSGFLVEGNYIVTVAHVVWGLPEIDVVFNDGTEHGDVSIAGYDHFADLAFLGPIDTPAPPVEFAEAESMTVEDTVFIVGNPSGPGGLSVTKGKFESVWHWPEADVVDVYSTAEGKPGMSGGPMTNGSGKVIGVYFRGRGTNPSWGSSSDTVRDRLQKLGRGEDITVLGPRKLPDIGEGSREHQFVLRDRWDAVTLVSEVSRHSVEFDSYRDVEYGFFDINGNGVFTPDFRTVQKGLTERCCITGPGFIEVRQRFDIERQVTLKSLAPLVRRDDPDDGRHLTTGDTVVGAIDTPGDIDRYTVHLSRGESIAIHLAGLKNILVTIDHAEAPPYDIVSEKVYFDEIKYRAPVDATYTVALQMSPGEFSHPLGYTLTLLKSWAAPKRLDSSALHDSPVGEILRHNFDHPASSIQIDYPANITGGGREVIAAELFEQDRSGRTVTLEKRDLNHHREHPDEGLTVADYMERSVLSSTFPYKVEKVVTARREVETPSGAPILIEDFEVDNGGMKGVRLAYIHEGETGFMAIFYAPGEVFDEWRPVVDHCIGTFSVGGFSLAEGMSDE